MNKHIVNQPLNICLVFVLCGPQHIASNVMKGKPDRNETFSYSLYLSIMAVQTDRQMIDI